MTTPQLLMQAIALLVTALNIGCSTSAATSRPHPATRSRSAPEGASSPAAPVAASALSNTIEAGFAVEQFTLSLKRDPAGAEIDVSAAEVNPRTSENERWTMLEQPGGAPIERIAMRHANEWYVVRRLPSGLASIERWQLLRTPGAYYAELDAAVTGIGTPVRTPPLVVGIENDRYVVPGQRMRPAIAKAQISAGIALGTTELMVADPDGRFLILQTSTAGGTRDLVQVALRASASPAMAVGDVVPLWSFSNLPEFPQATAIGQHDHARLGRALVISDSMAFVCFWDRDNDGVFENVESAASPFEWFEKYPYEAWSRNY